VTLPVNPDDMSTDHRTALRQILSAAAVVVSMVFVGLELRQNTLAQRAQTRQELANSSREVILTMTDNPAVARAYATMFLPSWGYTDTTLSAEDSLQGKWAMFANLRNLENVWLQVREGAVDEEVLATYAFDGPMYQSEVFRTMWERQWSTAFDTSFVRIFQVRNGF
jgi:hypothetical protein